MWVTPLESFSERMKEQLIEVFQDLFPGVEDLERITPQNTSSWDSLAHLNLILSIEEEFEIEVDPTDIPKLYKDFDTVLSHISKSKETLV